MSAPPTPESLSTHQATDVVDTNHDVDVPITDEEPAETHIHDDAHVEIDVDDNDNEDEDEDSVSSDSSIDEEEADASWMIKLKDIKTLSQLYTAKVVKPAKKTKFGPDPALLQRVSLFQGDITKLGADAIVNAANRSLLGGGGVDGAIHAAAGRKLLDECRTLNGCETGNSKLTRGYKLPANFIIHTVGPVYSKHEAEEKAEQLTSCYETSLQLAVENSIKEVAFPSISTGIYGYPIEDATRIALSVVRNFLESGPGNSVVDRVIFVVWSDKDKGVYESLLPEYFPPGEKPVEEQKEEASQEVAPKQDSDELEKNLTSEASSAAAAS